MLGTDYNIYYGTYNGNATGYQVIFGVAANGGALTNFTVSSVAPVPEPESLMYVGTGLLSVCGVLRRRFAA